MKSQSISHNVKRGIVHPDRNDSHYYSNRRGSQKYNIRIGKGSQTQRTGTQELASPAEAQKIIEAEGCQDQTIQAYTDGSKNEHGVGSRVAIFVGKELVIQLKFKLDNQCSNNQAELAIFKTLEVIDY